MSSEDFDLCEIETQVSKCTIHLEKIRKGGGGPHIVGESQGPNGSNLLGLPPCGQKVWVYDEVIHYEKKES